MTTPAANPERPAAHPGTWRAGDRPPLPRPTPSGWLRAGLRAVPLVLVLAAGLVATLILRPVEARVRGPARPVTGRITVAVCRAVLGILGLRTDRHGGQATGQGVIVTNHASWLDIFVLNAHQPMYFVAKSEVAGWAGIGWLARATGTLFIRRDRAQAVAHVAQFGTRLATGQRLTLFPEGTSSDGAQVLPFKPTLFEALVVQSAATPDLWVQPVAIRYTAPPDRTAQFYGWWGNMDFGPHLLAMLAQRRHGAVAVRYAPPIVVAGAGGRKALARSAERAVRSTFGDMASGGA